MAKNQDNFERKMIDSLDKANSTRVPTTGRLKVPASLSVPVPKERGSLAKPITTIEDQFDGLEVSFKLGFVGVGQGGARMAASFHDLGYRRVFLFNTVDKDWGGIDVNIPRLCSGHGGAAKDASVGERAAEDSRENIYAMLAKCWGEDVDYGIICVGGGGGTGSGAASVMIDIVRQYLKDQGKEGKVGVLLSLPSPSEGQQVCRNAITCVRRVLREECSPVILVDNSKINAVYRPSMYDLYPTANELVAYMLHAFNILAEADTPLTTFDKAELAHVMGSGIITLGAIQFEELDQPIKISEAIADQLANVLATVDESTGTRAACVFLGCKDTLGSLGLDFFEAGYAMLARKMAEGATIHRGVYIGDDPGLKAMVMLGGLAAPYTALKSLSEAAKLDATSLKSQDLMAFLGLDD